MLIAQITDLHVGDERVAAYYHLDTRLALRRAVDCVNALRTPPDLCMVTGDIVESGSAQEYRLARAELDRLAVPWFPIPGNHDERAAFLECFQDRLPREGDADRLDGFAQYAVGGWPLRILALDTLVPGENHGLLTGPRLDWLAAQLGRHADVSTLIAMHHPPFETAMPVIDGMILSDRTEFTQLIAKHLQVEAIVSGHIHRAIHGRVAHALASVAPSTAHQIGLAMSPQDAITFNHQPPGLQLHSWLGRGSWTTHTLPLGDFAGPFTF